MNSVKNVEAVVFFFKCEQHAPTINMYVEDINVQMSDNHAIIYIGKWE